MNALESVSETVQRAIVFGIILYFVLFLYGEFANDIYARIAANIVFGFVALGVGGVLFSAAEKPFSPLGGSGICLIVGGIAQLIAVVLVDILIDAIASIAVFVGIGLYVFAVWTDS
ncbi:hypothetical protein [Natronosalvus vescus]|uniref:hypothetical protein n=1 Tax=Natronosalvus vescus TaxID=2953881 RepID=UPI0020919776|nr:hypothetical protein [Natronosalvus vescus]